ncbi:MAG TPA: BREX system ATP-binding domain-containing protein [Bryobacteraceae bacterium]|nr:BREX system ATP-binding domain-containing protein [Bryobacteraceae bacterium]
MTASIRPAEWIRLIEQEYLAGYVRDGGSAVKFAVPQDENLRNELFRGLDEVGRLGGYLVAGINAADTKVHMIDEIFFRVAQQVPWRELSLKMLVSLAAESGYSWVREGEGPLYRRLAEANGVDPQMLLLDLKKAIWSKVVQRPSLSNDFRTAMNHLCLAELLGGQEGATTTATLLDWMMGRNRAVGAVKPYLIFRKINRATARYYFESMAHWVRLAGYAGMLIVIDMQRVMLAQNPRDESIFYGKSAVMDAYEVLREFIDRADRLEGCLITVVPETTFLEEHTRGLLSYTALHHRVFDEVRDRSLVNPMAALARIAAATAGN